MATKVARLAPEPSEAAVLSAILRALKFHKRVAWFERMNSGALLNAQGRPVRFGFKGCPDILGQLADGRFLAIEVKRPSGRIRPEQASFIEKVRATGGVAFVARSVADVFETLDSLGRA